MTPDAAPPAPRRVVYLCDWLPPEFGAVGQYALRAAEESRPSERVAPLTSRENPWA